MPQKHRVHFMPVSGGWPAHVNEMQRVGRTDDELVQIVELLTRYDRGSSVDESAKGRHMEQVLRSPGAS